MRGAYLHRPGCRYATATVIELLNRQGRLLTADKPTATVDRDAAGSDVKQAVTLQQSLAVIQAHAAQGGGSTDDFTVVIVQGSVDGQCQIIADVQLAFGVNQAVCVQVQPRGSDQALGVVQRTGNTHHKALLAEQLAAPVVEAACGKRQGLGAGNFPGLVIDTA